ncbi:hypothetical protein PSPO01_08122 [Paraphaeosphaeria sporulosa]
MLLPSRSTFQDVGSRSRQESSLANDSAPFQPSIPSLRPFPLHPTYKHHPPPLPLLPRLPIIPSIISDFPVPSLSLHPLTLPLHTSPIKWPIHSNNLPVHPHARPHQHQPPRIRLRHQYTSASTAHLTTPCRRTPSHTRRYRRIAASLLTEHLPEQRLVLGMLPRVHTAVHARRVEQRVPGLLPRTRLPGPREEAQPVGGLCVVPPREGVAVGGGECAAADGVWVGEGEYEVVAGYVAGFEGGAGGVGWRGGVGVICVCELKGLGRAFWLEELVKELHGRQGAGFRGWEECFEASLLERDLAEC